MIRISDIIKMGSEPDQPKENKDKNQETLFNKVSVKSSEEDIKELYNQGLDLLKDIFDKARKTRQFSAHEAQAYLANTIDFKQVTDYANLLVERTQLGNGKLFDYFYAYKDEDYLHIHSLNVCLLAVKIGIWLSMNKSDLVNIAIGGLLHDIGLITVEDMISSSRKLKHNEMQQINEHPAHSVKMLEKIKGLAEDVIGAVRGHHKRFGDKDFSKELSSERLQKITQIIGLADVYEAITHPRSYRGPKLPHEAIKELIENESDNFHSRIIKSLVDNIGIYPIGSWVRLTNGEIGIVISINKGYPLRPKTNIIFDSKNEKLKDVKLIDLLNEPHLHIEGPVDIDSNKHLLDKLK